MVNLIIRVLLRLHINVNFLPLVISWVLILDELWWLILWMPHREKLGFFHCLHVKLNLSLWSQIEALAWVLKLFGYHEPVLLVVVSGWVYIRVRLWVHFWDVVFVSKNFLKLDWRICNQFAYVLVIIEMLSRARDLSGRRIFEIELLCLWSWFLELNISTFLLILITFHGVKFIRWGHHKILWQLSHLDSSLLFRHLKFLLILVIEIVLKEFSLVLVNIGHLLLILHRVLFDLLIREFGAWLEQVHSLIFIQVMM